MKLLVTGANGFVGKNLCTALAQIRDTEVWKHDVNNSPDELLAALREVDVIFHLAGVNRPEKPEDYATGNAGVTAELCQQLEKLGRAPKVVLSSSIQIEHDNPYGKSKLAAEEALRDYCTRGKAPGVIHRFKNLFGKWCRPNYNSVTATFCHNIAHDLPIAISDRERMVDLTYIDDVVAALLTELTPPFQPGCRLAPELPSYAISLGELADTISAFHRHRTTLLLPNFSQPFVRALYATYLSYIDPEHCAYQLDIKSDPRGSLAELIKSPCFGQIFVSRTKPGITRGNHFHHTKTEKFMVVQGEAMVRLRHIDSGVVSEHHAKGEDYRVVDIPPGYTHSIENTGASELVTLFWASEVFDATHPDTMGAPVIVPQP